MAFHYALSADLGPERREAAHAPPLSSAAIEVRGLWKIYSRQKGDVLPPGIVENPEALEALEKERRVVVAVRDAAFSVEPGETFIVMGLSGSGKSTLIRCLMRLVEPTAGNISVNGRNVTAMTPQELVHFRRTEVAMVFQHYGLLPHRTVLENASFGLKLRGEEAAARTDKAKEILSRVGLEGWGRAYPASLSGGMRQRVGIARALVMDSPILFMDEPFSGLDPLIRRELQDELIRLQRTLRKTIFFVTHDLSEALRLGDRMAVMRKGSIVQIGSPDDIIADPADDYVARFVQDEREQVARAERRMAEHRAG